jgi:hypothetical protein
LTVIVLILLLVVPRTTGWTTLGRQAGLGQLSLAMEEIVAKDEMLAASGIAASTKNLKKAFFIFSLLQLWVLRQAHSLITGSEYETVSDYFLFTEKL